jgi:mannose-6-phosphate isomerase-like protein (cupin superfamily)
MNKIKIVTAAIIFFVFVNSIIAQTSESDYTVYSYSTVIDKGDSLEKNILLKDQENLIGQFTLRNGKSLGMHTDNNAFWVYAIAGSGDLVFENDRIVKLEPGKLVTVKPGVPHDVIAKPEVSIMVIKFLEEDNNEKRGDHEQNK